MNARPPYMQFEPADRATRRSSAHDAAINVLVGNDGGISVDAPDDDYGDEGEAPPKTGYMRHEFDENLAEHLTDPELRALSSELQQGIDGDMNDHREWAEIASMYVDYLGLKVMKDVGSNDSSSALSRIWDPLMLEATIHFWANAVGEFLPADGPAKIRDDAPPAVAGMGHNGGPPLEEATPPGGGAVTRDDLAQAFEKDFNHYLTVGDRAYYRDWSRMLMSLGPMGTEFRKIYWCPLRGRPVSEWVRSTNLVVSSDATDLSNAARATEIIKMSQARAKRLMASGWWRKCDLMQPQETSTPVDNEIRDAEGIQRNVVLGRDHQHTIQECYTELDLAGFWHTDEDGEETGLPLPYRVTIDKTSGEILEIRRNWREEDPLFTARQRYVFFGMMPGLGFYSLGFMHILGNGELTLTSIGRQLLDAGMFENFPGFLIAKGFGRQVTTDMQVNPGQGREIDTGGKPISQVVMPLPYKGASQTLAALASAMVERFQKLAGAADVPIGEGTADVPVGTVIAMLEQSTKIMAAVHKGLHASRAEELEMLRELIAEDPSVLSRGNKRAARQWEQAEEFRDLDLVPSSDPNVPSQLHRIMQATALAQVATQMPGVFNPRWVAEDILRTIGKEVPDEAFAPPAQPGQNAPPPDPAKMMMAQAAQLRAQTEAQKAQQSAGLDQTETQRKAAESAVQAENERQSSALDAQTKAAEMASKERIAGMQEQTERVRLAVETAKSAHEAGLAEAQHAHTVHQAQQSRADGIAGLATGGGQGAGS